MKENETTIIMTLVAQDIIIVRAKKYPVIYTIHTYYNYNHFRVVSANHILLLIESWLQPTQDRNVARHAKWQFLWFYWEHRYHAAYIFLSMVIHGQKLIIPNLSDSTHVLLLIYTSSTRGNCWFINVEIKTFLISNKKLFICIELL